MGSVATADARNGLKWTNAIDANQLRTAIEEDVALRLPASVVWEMPLEIWRCRSDHSRCGEGSFAEKLLPADQQPSKVLVFPNDFIFEPGWFARYVSEAPVAGRANVTLHDSQKANGNRSFVIRADEFFQKRVYGLASNRTYYLDFAGLSPNETGCAAACPGADAGMHCRRSCSGPSGSVETLELEAAAPAEPLVVELSLARDVSHTEMALQLAAAGSWRFEGQLRDELTPPTRAVFNSTLAAFGVADG